jgi:hypothetical protein
MEYSISSQAVDLVPGPGVRERHSNQLTERKGTCINKHTSYVGASITTASQTLLP